MQLPSALICEPMARITLGRSCASREATMTDTPWSIRAMCAGLSRGDMGVQRKRPDYLRKRWRVKARATQ